MAIIRIRYLVAKKQKGHVIYYWQPKKELRIHGFYPMRLASKTNTLEDAIREAQVYNAELDAWRKTGLVKNEIQEGSMSWLINKYLKSKWYSKLAVRTQKDYTYELEDINKFCGQYQIDHVTRRVCKAYYELMCNKSTHNGNAAIRVLRVLFSYAVDGGIIDENPVKGIRLIGTDARQQIWTHDECKKLIEKALSENRRSIALAFIIAEHTAQRESDVLQMRRSQYDGVSLKIKQDKTGALIHVKCTKVLKQWLDETAGDSDYFIVSETTGEAYKGDNFRHLFSSIKSGLGLDDKLFMDLRRTAIVRLAEAGCELPEIAAVSGHNIKTCAKILEVYLPRNSTMASNAIDKLELHNKNKLDLRLEHAQ